MSKFFLFIVLSSFSSLVFSDGPTALKSLGTKLEKIETFSASFVQYSIDQSGSRMQESRGELKASRDGRLYWHTFEPLEQIVSSDGKSVTVYDPDLEQATIQGVSDQIATTPAILFSGEVAKIGEHYEVESVPAQEGFSSYSLVPKSKDGLFERLRIRFLKDNVNELSIVDSLGQRSTMSFIQTQINPELSADDFLISLPDGTDIIENIPVPNP